MKKTGIYKITSPTSKVYIGQSVNINKRFNTYKNLKCKKQPKLYNSFKKYGVDKHIFEVVELCVEAKLNSRELYHIELLNTVNNGLNCRYPAANGKSGRLSNNTINKIIVSATGRVHTKQTKEKLREFNKGKKLTIEHKNKIAKSSIGKYISNDSKLKMSIAKQGKKLSKKHKEAIRVSNIDKSNSKIILDVNTGVYYVNAKTVVNLYGFSYGTFTSKLAGHRKNNTQFIYA